MTHTHHRRGPRESLERDFVVLFMLDVEEEAQRRYGGPLEPRVQRILEILRSYEPLALIAGRGEERLRYIEGWEPRMNGGVHRSSTLDEVAGCRELVDEGEGHAVYTSREAVERVLKELGEADLGFSVVVSGVFDEVFEACRRAGLEPHTVNMSLGTWGRTELLPDPKILELCTMCGHAMISPRLVEAVAERVRGGVMTVGEASVELGKQCTCNIFNTERAREIIQSISS